MVCHWGWGLVYSNCPFWPCDTLCSQRAPTGMPHHCPLLPCLRSLVQKEHRVNALPVPHTADPYTGVRLPETSPWADPVSPVHFSMPSKYRVASGVPSTNNTGHPCRPAWCQHSSVMFYRLESRGMPSGFSAKQEPQQVHSCSPTASNFQALLHFRQPLLPPALLP